MTRTNATTHCERDSRQAFEAPEPLLFTKRDRMSLALAALYAGTETELDIKVSDAHAKENLQPVRWP